MTATQAPTRVAMLRAINVGGTGRLAMADLRALMAKLGYHDVATVGASGNVIYRTSDSSCPPHEDAARIAAAVALLVGRATPCVVRTADDLAALVASDPFAKLDAAVPDKWRFVLLSTTPLAPREKVPPPQVATLTLVGHDAGAIYYAMHAADRKALDYPKQLEKALGATLTARNWNVVRQIAAKAAAAPT